jgi:hypothetical protein
VDGPYHAGDNGTGRTGNCRAWPDDRLRPIVLGLGSG